MHKNLNLNTTGFGLFLYRIPILRPETGCLFLLSCFFLFGSGAKHFQSLKVIKRHHLLNYSLINCDKWGRSSVTKIYLFASPPLCFIKTMHWDNVLFLRAELLVEVPHGLPLLVVQQHVGPHLLHPRDRGLGRPLVLPVLRHQPAAHQRGAPGHRAQYNIQVDGKKISV